MLKGTKKFSERWMKVATISREKELISLEDTKSCRASSAGSTRSAVTMKSDLDGSWNGGSRSRVGSALGWASPSGDASCVSGMVKLPLVDFIDLVIDNSACIHQTDLKEATVLHYSALKGRTDLIEYVVGCGGDVKAKDSAGETPLHWAVRGDSPGAVNVLMRAGADITALNDLKMAPLHLACHLDLPDVVEALCSHENVNVNIPGEYGQTPLHYCAMKNSFEAAKRLMNYKPLYCKKDDNGVFVIHCAATHASRDVLNMLLEKAEESGYPRDYVLRQNDKENNTALHSAVNSGSEEAVGVCIEFGSPLDVLQEDKSTPLHLAASQGSLPIVKLLLRPQGSERTLSMCDVEEMTPLHRAAMFDHINVVDYLVAQGADKDAIDKNGYSPLLRAVSRGSFRSAASLSQYGSDMNLRDCRNRNILHLAVLSGKTLTTYGLDKCKFDMKALLNDVDVMGCTPIHYATRDGNIKCLQNLIELGATVNLKNFEKQSPLHFAAKYGRLNSCKRLLDSSIGPNIINDIDGEGMTALHIASVNGHAKVIQLLLLRGALLHRDYKGRTPLHLAAMAGYLDCMKLYLTTHGYLLDQTDDSGDTALMLAASEGMTASVDFLLTNRASLLLNKDGKCVMAIAAATNNIDVALTIVAHDRWCEVLKEYIIKQKDSLRTLIGKMPDVYKKVLDRCVTKSSDPPNCPTFWVKYEFSYLQAPVAERIRINKTSGAGLCKPLPSMNLMVENNHMDLLSHPVCIEYLNMKWKSYGAMVHSIGMGMHVLFVACLMFFILKIEGHFQFPPGTGSGLSNTTTGDTAAATSPSTTLLPHQQKLSTWMWAFSWAMVAYCVGNILKECSQILYQPRKYVRDFTNYLEWGLYSCTLVFITPLLFDRSVCYWDSELCCAQWQCGAVAIFLSLFLALMYQQRINIIGIYVVMFQVILKTLVQVLVVFAVLIFAFSMAMYMLMKNEENNAFHTIPLSMFRVFTMMLAEIDLINSFVAPTTDDNLQTMTFVHLSYGFLGLLIIFLPIILMNLLIGLAVGDIASVQQDAKLQRLAMQVETYTEMEEKLPTKFLEWVDKDHILLYPNRKGCTDKSFVKQLIKKVKKTVYGKSDDQAKAEVAVKTIHQFRVNDEAEQGDGEMAALKNKFKTLSNQMDKQYDLLRLIVQKMEISTEADEQDEGMAPPTDHCQGQARINFRQVVTAAAMMREGARERMTLYNGIGDQKAINNKPPEPSV